MLSSLSPRIKFAFALFVWYTASIMANITWKWAIRTYHSVLPLTLIQFAVGEMVALTIVVGNWYSNKSYVSYKILTKKEDMGCSLLILLMGLTFALGQLCTNASLSISSVALTNAIKTTEPCVALIFGVFILRNPIPPRAILFMLILMGGAAITSKSDSSFSANGALYAAFSNVVLQTRNVLIKSAANNSQVTNNGTTMFLYSNTFGMLFLLFANIFCTALNGFSWDDIRNINALCIMTGVFFALQHMSSYVVLDYALITTHSLLNVSKRVLIILIGSVILGSTVTMKQNVGICITFTSLYFYMKTLNKHNIKMVKESLGTDNTNE